MTNREKRMKSLVAQIKLRVHKLKELGYSYSDCASTIFLFDDKMFKESFMYLSTEDQHKTMIDTLE